MKMDDGFQFFFSACRVKNREGSRHQSINLDCKTLGDEKLLSADFEWLNMWLVL